GSCPGMAHPSIGRPPGHAAQCYRWKEDEPVSAQQQDANATQEIGRPVNFLRVRDPGGRPPLACSGNPASRRACGQIKLRKKMPETLVEVLTNSAQALRLKPGSWRSRSANAAVAATSSSTCDQSSCGGSDKFGPSSALARSWNGRVM